MGQLDALGREQAAVKHYRTIHALADHDRTFAQIEAAKHRAWHA